MGWLLGLDWREWVGFMRFLGFCGMVARFCEVRQQLRCYGGWDVLIA